MSPEPAPDRRRRERRRLDDERFWQALRTERRVAERRRPPAATGDTVAASASGAAPAYGDRAGNAPPEPAAEAGPTPAQEARRAALRSLLEAAEARHERVGRARAPVLASGARVRVSGGELAGHVGVVLDADYIESRVLLRLDADGSSRWLPFALVGSDRPGSDR